MSTEEIVAKLKEFARGHKDIVAVYLFGSRARGDAISHSDTDVAVLLHPSSTTVSNDELRLQGEAMNALGTDEVDVLVLNHLPPAFQFVITTEGRPIHSNDELTRIDWEVDMLGRYYDIHSFQKLYDRAYLRRLKETFTDDQRREYERTLAALAAAN